MPGHDPQLLKGVLSILLLRLLVDRESYGYELVQQLAAAGLPDVLEGTVYPALARLEREGWVATHLVRSSAGPARKYYRLTADGHAHLMEASEAWRSFVAVVDDVLHAPTPVAPEPGA
ncbi:MAG TPA: PadR family transcriptional regulator [Aquihabitans sp.]|nr:PadR family transcriptional regulator [Aquihabitans sp.]